MAEGPIPVPAGAPAAAAAPGAPATAPAPVAIDVWAATLPVGGNGARAGARDLARDVACEVLAGVLGATRESLRFDRRCRHCGDETHGKPRLVDVPDVSFSVAHSGRLAVVAVARGVEIGVDVEVVRPRRRLDGLAARVLTAAEHDAWRALPEPQRLEAFLAHWTAREAYLKAIGVGLATGRVGVPGGLRGALAHARGWTIRPLAVPGAVGAVAAPRDVRVRTHAWRR